MIHAFLRKEIEIKQIFISFIFNKFQFCYEKSFDLEYSNKGNYFVVIIIINLKEKVFAKYENIKL